MSLRVFELAKELNVPTKELIKKINNMGIEISGNFSSLSESDATTIKKNFLQPSTRIEETVVPSGEGVTRVRRRIISAKKAVEGRKIRKSLHIEDKPVENDVETRKKMSETDVKTETEVENEKTSKKVIKNKTVENKEEQQTETESNKESQTAVKIEK
ncbi:translation initiation factor IF-2 N-terminal domain-containing protein, partial [bacterium]|nr:translation initiation factor IF-2 N-terminal domain-containing protein [bacterium]